MITGRKWMCLMLPPILGAMLMFVAVAARDRTVAVEWQRRGGGDTIKVGEFASLTARRPTFGQMSHHGTQLAIEEVNAAGECSGKRLN